MHTRRIALLGAPGSGKTWLARQLAAAFASVTAQAPSVGKAPDIDDDPPLTGAPLPHQAVLLMGLDLSAPAPSTLKADLEIRQALAAARTSFHVIYGRGPERLANALTLLKALGLAMEPEPPRTSEPVPRRKPWVWACEKCSDPVCEHRLLSDLLARR